MQENVRGEGRWNDKDDASTNATYVVCHVRKEEKKKSVPRAETSVITILASSNGIRRAVVQIRGFTSKNRWFVFDRVLIF